MKIRIYQDSLRIRITLSELEELAREKTLQAVSVLPGSKEPRRFRHAITLRSDSEPTELVWDDDGWTLWLSPQDLQRLQSSEREGITLAQNWLSEDRRPRKCSLLLEKDRIPG